MLAPLTDCFQTREIEVILTMKLTVLIVSCLLFAAVQSAAVAPSDAEVRCSSESGGFRIFL